MVLKKAVSGLGSFSKKLPFPDRKFLTGRKSKRPYIVPTGFGWAFGAMGLVLFFMADGYTNNLIFIFFFLLISTGFTAMILANRNMQVLEFAGLIIPGLFAREEGKIGVRVQNSSDLQSWAFKVYWQGTGRTGVAEATEFAAAAQQQNVCEISFVPNARGLQILPRIIFQSYFPFGLFRAWKVFAGSAEVLIFPERKGQREFPAGLRATGLLPSSGLFRDHRIYQPGDSVRRIDWKASSRRLEMLVKNFEEAERPALHFEWHHTHELVNFEARLSQLALWIDEAERQNLRYSLAVGPHHFMTSQGLVHWRRCLEALALLRLEDVA